MAIEEFNIYVAESNLGGKFYNPRILWHRKQYVFVELLDSSGHVGWGECWTFDQSADALIRFIQTELRPKLLGKCTESISDVWQDLWSDTVLSGRHGMAAAAISGIDCALWDIAAKMAGKPVCACLPASGERRSVPVYASGGLYRKDGGLEDLAAEMKQHVSNGFRCVKMKFGALEFEEDLERINTVREAIGPDTELVVDAVYSLDRASAELWIPHLQDARIQAIQAPFSPRDWDSMRWMNQDVGIPVMVFEAESRYAVFRALFEFGAIGLLQFSPIAVGGITASLELIKLAEKFDKDVTLQCSSTWLAEVIALHIASAKPSVRHVEMHTFHRFLFDEANPDETIVCDGSQTIFGKDGFGFTVPKSRLGLCNDALPDFQGAKKM